MHINLKNMYNQYVDLYAKGGSRLLVYYEMGKNQIEQSNLLYESRLTMETEEGIHVIGLN